MKLLHIFIATILLCSTASATMYSIRCVVWDEDGNREGGVAVTCSYDGQKITHLTAPDGTIAFSLMNFGNVPDGAEINMSCKYGIKQAPVDYNIGTSGVTWNAPSSLAAMAAFTAMGFTAIAVLGRKGIYLLKRKKQSSVKEKT